LDKIQKEDILDFVHIKFFVFDNVKTPNSNSLIWLCMSSIELLILKKGKFIFLDVNSSYVISLFPYLSLNLFVSYMLSHIKKILS